MTSNILLRKIDSRTTLYLKTQAKKQGISVNALILKLMKGAAGIDNNSMLQSVRYNDLDCLAGTWNKKDLREFNKNTAFFETIDSELWR